jgi:hypothetical protein
MVFRGEQGFSAFWQDRRRAWIAGGIALLALVAIPAVLLAAGSSDTSSSPGSRNGSGASSTSSTSTTTTEVPTTTSPSIDLAPVVPTTTPPTLPPPVVTGTVTRAGGAPVPRAHVVGLDDLSTVTTNVKGEFAMLCTGQALTASPWAVPVKPAGGGAPVFDGSGTVPNELGPGYMFSGGATDVAKAASVPCDGKPVDLRLPLGATVVVSLRDASGARFVPAPGQAPLDSFSLPGFGGRADTVGAPISKTGVQVLPQLGAGTLTIHVAHGTFTCRGDGVVPSTPTTTVSVPTVPGDLVAVKCRMSG